MFDLTGRVAVVTGASSGLGAQFSHALADQGAHLVLMARRAEKLEELAGEIRKKGRTVLAVPCDVTETDQIKHAVEKTINEFGKVDILVTSAGGNSGEDAVSMSDGDWKKVIDLDLNGVFYCCREFGRPMLEKGYGRIVNIASMYGLVGNNFKPAAAYHAAKGGVVNLTRALGAEWAKTGVTVNAIGPGFFSSELTDKFIDAPEFLEAVKAYCPMGRVGKPGELNGALIYLASEEAGYTTGATLYVDGGWTAI